MSAPAALAHDARVQSPTAPGALTFTGGIGAVVRGAVRLGREPELRRLAVAPVLLTLAITTLGLVGAALTVDDAVAALWAPPAGRVAHAAWAAVVVLVFVALAVLLVLLFVGLATAVAGPFHERLALRVLSRLGVERRDVGFVHGLAVDLAWALTFTAPAGTLGMIALVPGIGLPFAVASVTIASLGLASAALGPAVGALGGGYRRRWAMVWRHLAFVAGAAVVVGLAVIVPVLGLLVVPAAVVGLTERLAQSGALQAP